MHPTWLLGVCQVAKVDLFFDWLNHHFASFCSNVEVRAPGCSERGKPIILMFFRSPFWPCVTLLDNTYHGWLLLDRSGKGRRPVDHRVGAPSVIRFYYHSNSAFSSAFVYSILQDVSDYVRILPKFFFLSPVFLLLLHYLSFYSSNTSNGVIISGVDNLRRPLILRICFFLLAFAR